MLHYPSDTDNADTADLEAFARAIGVLRTTPLRYQVPTNLCALCSMPTGGVLCTPCATSR